MAHHAEKQNYEGQLSDLRGEYTKTKDELDGEIMVLILDPNLFVKFSSCRY